MRFAKICNALAIVSYYYDQFRKGKIDDDFSVLAEQTMEAEYSIYQLLSLAGVYASGIAALICFAVLMLNSKGGGTKLAESKDAIIKVMIVSTLIFSVAELVSFVQKVAMAI